MGKQRRSYSREFKVEMAGLVLDKGMTVREVSEDLGINPSVIRSWVRQERIDRKDGKSGELTTEEREELRRLRRETRILREELEILKKAAAFFAKPVHKQQLRGFAQGGGCNQQHEPKGKLLGQRGHRKLLFLAQI